MEGPQTLAWIRRIEAGLRTYSDAYLARCLERHTIKTEGGKVQAEAPVVYPHEKDFVWHKYQESRRQEAAGAGAPPAKTLQENQGTQ